MRMRALVLLVVLVAAAGDDADDDDDAPEYGQRTHSNSKRQSVEAAAPSIVPIYNSHPSDEYLQQLYARASIGARGGYTGVPQGWLGMGYAMDSSSSSAHRRPQNTSISDNKASTAGKSPASSRRRTSHATAQRLKCVNSRKLKCTRVRIKQQPPVTSQHNGGHRLHPADNLHRRLQLRNGNTLQLGSKRSLRNAEFEGGHWRRGFERSLVAAGEPEQISLAYGRTPDSMTITWVTSATPAEASSTTSTVPALDGRGLGRPMQRPPSTSTSAAFATAPVSIVHYGGQPGNYSGEAHGTFDNYVFSSNYSSGWIHSVTVTGLQLNRTYYYRVSSTDSGRWNDVEYWFTTNPGVGSDKYPYSLAVIADIGSSPVANTTIYRLRERLSTYHMLMISGDLAYADGCESIGCNAWDAFQRMLQPVSQHKPVMVSFGNHELWDTSRGVYALSAWVRYKGMPSAPPGPGGPMALVPPPPGQAGYAPMPPPDALSTSNSSTSTHAEPPGDGPWYYSYEAGPAHIVHISPYYPGGLGGNSQQTRWLEWDLQYNFNRSRTPWLLMSQHTPWITSNTAHSDDGAEIRTLYEGLLLQYGVNVIFCGHVHAYERSLPMGPGGSIDYRNGIVHINTGASGAPLYPVWQSQQPPMWSAARSLEYGHGEFVMQNNTHARWTWRRSYAGGFNSTIVDKAWVINSQWIKYAAAATSSSSTSAVPRTPIASGSAARWGEVSRPDVSVAFKPHR